jgi:ribonuclease BN (tRNA processing enzyme)
MLVRIIGGHGGVSPGFKATSYLIDGKLLLDAGSVASGIRIEEQSNIDHILISHSHLDHISDLAFLADNCFGMKEKPFDIYASTAVKMAIKTHLLNDVIWPDFTLLPSKEKPTLCFHDVEPGKPLVLGDYKIIPISVNHSNGALGFIIERKNATVIFTQDTGPTEEIWEQAKKVKNLKAIFTEVSFPNALAKVATDSLHHTPNTMKEEIKKMPKDVPIFLGHLKPNFQSQLFKEIDEIGEERITVLGSSDTSYVF